MADKEKDKGAPASGNGNGAPSFSGGEAPRVTGAPPPPDPSVPRMNVLAQYVKDLSFENPGAPESLKSRQSPPKVDIKIVEGPPVPAAVGAPDDAGPEGADGPGDADDTPPAS